MTRPEDLPLDLKVQRNTSILMAIGEPLIQSPHPSEGGGEGRDLGGWEGWASDQTDSIRIPSLQPAEAGGGGIVEKRKRGSRSCSWPEMAIALVMVPLTVGNGGV